MQSDKTSRNHPADFSPLASSPASSSSERVERQPTSVEGRVTGATAKVFHGYETASFITSSATTPAISAEVSGTAAAAASVESLRAPGDASSRENFSAGTAATTPASELSRGAESLEAKSRDEVKKEAYETYRSYAIATVNQIPGAKQLRDADYTTRVLVTGKGKLKRVEGHGIIVSIVSQSKEEGRNTVYRVTTASSAEASADVAFVKIVSRTGEHFRQDIRLAAKLSLFFTKANVVKVYIREPRQKSSDMAEERPQRKTIAEIAAIAKEVRKAAEEAEEKEKKKIEEGTAKRAQKAAKREEEIATERKGLADAGMAEEDINEIIERKNKEYAGASAAEDAKDKAAENTFKKAKEEREKKIEERAAKRARKIAEKAKEMARYREFWTNMGIAKESIDDVIQRKNNEYEIILDREEDKATAAEAKVPRIPIMKETPGIDGLMLTAEAVKDLCIDTSKINWNSSISQATAVIALSFQMWDGHRLNMGSDANGNLVLFDLDQLLLESNTHSACKGVPNSPLGQLELQSINPLIEREILTRHVKELGGAIQSQICLQDMSLPKDGKKQHFSPMERATITDLVCQFFGEKQEFKIYGEHNAVDGEPCPIISTEPEQEQPSHSHAAVKELSSIKENFNNTLTFTSDYDDFWVLLAKAGLSQDKINFLKKNPRLLHPRDCSIAQFNALRERRVAEEGFLKLLDAFDSSSRLSNEEKITILLKNLNSMPVTAEKKIAFFQRLNRGDSALKEEVIIEVKAILFEKSLCFNMIAAAAYPTLKKLITWAESKRDPEGVASVLSWAAASNKRYKVELGKLPKSLDEAKYNAEKKRMFEEGKLLEEEYKKTLIEELNKYREFRKLYEADRQGAEN